MHFSLTDEKKMGLVNGWLYVVGRRVDGESWLCVRRSHCRACHGGREELIAFSGTIEGAEREAQKSIKRVRRGIGDYFV